MIWLHRGQFAFWIMFKIIILGFIEECPLFSRPLTVHWSVIDVHALNPWNFFLSMDKIWTTINASPHFYSHLREWKPNKYYDDCQITHTHTHTQTIPIEREGRNKKKSLIPNTKCNKCSRQYFGPSYWSLETLILHVICLYWWKNWNSEAFYCLMECLNFEQLF